MSSAEVTLPQPATGLPTRVLRLVPGIGLLAAVGYAGKLSETALKHYGAAHHVALPNIEYVLWAILYGLLVGNFFGRASWYRIFNAGIATYEFFLKLGIVLLGVRFLLADVAKLGALSLGLVVLEISVSIAVMIAFGRWFRLGPKLTALLAVGASVCGVSAIIATEGAIEASDEDTAYAIAAILALGAFGLFLFPLIGHFLGMSDRAFGLWVGLAIDNTAEVTAAGALYSDEAGRVAVLAKTARNATIGFVVLAVALYFTAREGRTFTGSKAKFVWSKFPKFVLGFVVLSIAASIKLLSPPHITALANLSRWAFLFTFAGVGLRTNFRDLVKQGYRPFVVGALGEVTIAALTLGMVVGADALFHLG